MTPVLSRIDDFSHLVASCSPTLPGPLTALDWQHIESENHRLSQVRRDP